MMAAFRKALSQRQKKVDYLDALIVKSTSSKIWNPHIDGQSETRIQEIHFISLSS